MVKRITSPGWMHETSARAWCTGKTHRNQVEMEVEGGIGMGNTCKSMADSCQCMTKTTTIFKVISLQLIKINEKKKTKQEMARVNVNLLGISKLKWTGMGEFNSDDHYLLLWAGIP